MVFLQCYTEDVEISKSWVKHSHEPHKNIRTLCINNAQLF